MILGKQNNSNIHNTINLRYCESISKENIELTLFLQNQGYKKVAYIHVHIYDITYLEPSLFSVLILENQMTPLLKVIILCMKSYLVF